MDYPKGCPNCKSFDFKQIGKTVTALRFKCEACNHVWFLPNNKPVFEFRNTNRRQK